jgi:hypothetical protein
VIDRSFTKIPIRSYAIAPYQPARGATLYAKFVQGGDASAETEIAIEEAIEAKKAEIVDAQRKAIDTAKTGKPATVSISDIAAKHDKVIADLRAKLAAQLAACDELGNEWARGAVEIADEWDAELASRKEEAIARIRDLLPELRAALATFAPLPRAQAWVRGLDLGELLTGQYGQFPGGSSLMVRDPSIVRGVHSEPVDAFKLLDLLATAVAPPEASGPRTHLTAAGSTMRWQ